MPHSLGTFGLDKYWFLDPLILEVWSSQSFVPPPKNISSVVPPLQSPRVYRFLHIKFDWNEQSDMLKAASNCMFIFHQLFRNTSFWVRWPTTSEVGGGRTSSLKQSMKPPPPPINSQSKMLKITQLRNWLVISYSIYTCFKSSAIIHINYLTLMI